MKLLIGFFTLTTLWAQASTIQLSGGEVGYTLRDHGHSKNVVLFHSGTLPAWTMSSYQGPLAKKGFNTLKFDLYGMGKSQHPQNVRHNRDLFIQQISELLLRLDWVGPNAKPLYFLGVGSGAAIAAAYMATHSGDVEKLFAISPAYDIKDTKSWFSRRLLGVMNWFPNSQYFRNKTKKQLKAAVLKIFDRLPTFKRKIATKRFERELADPKYIDAMYRRLIGDFYKSYKWEFSQLAIQNTPLKIVSGETDQNTPSHHLLEIQQMYNQPRLIDIEVVLQVGAELYSIKSRGLAEAAGDFFNK